MSGVRVRPATTGDVDAITQLMNAHGTAVHGESEAAPTTVLEWLEDPELVIRLGERDGRLACYGDIVFSADGTRMLVHLDAAPEPARWPEGITVREMRECEQRATHAAGNEAFADHWEFEPAPYERFARWNFERANFDRSLSFLALDDDEIAGICLCSMHWSGDPIGRRESRPSRTALLLHSFAVFRERGCTRVGLGVDAESTTGPLELYERAGMHVHRCQDTLEKLL